MTRRLFPVFSALSAAIGTITARPQPSIKTLFDDLTEQFRAWIPLQNEYMANVGESPIQAQRQWDAVRRAFHELDVAVRNQ